MISFAEIWEQMEMQKSPLMNSGEETRGNQVVRAGEQLRKEGETSFWDDFLSLLSNTEGVADLLNVSADKVLSWPARIKDAQEKTKQSNIDKDEEESKVVPTGDNGAITATNQDPML